MGLGDRLRNAVNAAKAEVVVAKANHDSRKAGYNPKDYAGFNGEGLSAESAKGEDDEDQ